MSITGDSDEDGGGPTKVGVAISDVVTGLFGAIGILAALLARERGTAGGQRVDVSLLGSTLADPGEPGAERVRHGSGARPTGQRPSQHRPVRDVRDRGRPARHRRRIGAPVAALLRGPGPPRPGRRPAVRHQRRSRGAPRRPATAAGRATSRPGPAPRGWRPWRPPRSRADRSPTSPLPSRRPRRPPWDAGRGGAPGARGAPAGGDPDRAVHHARRDPQRAPAARRTDRGAAGGARVLRSPRSPGFARSASSRARGGETPGASLPGPSRSARSWR